MKRPMLPLMLCLGLLLAPHTVALAPLAPASPIDCPEDVAALQCRAAAWTLREEDARSDWGALRATVHDGVLYVPVRPPALLAVNVETGALLWRAEVDAARVIEALPGADGARVLVATNGPAALVAFDTTTGAVAWRTQLDFEPQGLSLDAERGRVTVAGTFYPRTWDGTAAAVTVDEASGDPLWRWERPMVGGEKSWTSGVAIAPDGDVVLVGRTYQRASSATFFTRLDGDSGEVAAAVRLPFSIQRHFALSQDGGLAVVTGEGGVVGVRTTDAALLWHTPLPISGIEAIARGAGDRFYLTGWGEGGYTTARVEADGSIGWLATYAGRLGVCSYARDLAVSPDGERVYVTGYSAGLTIAEDYVTIAYDAQTGVEQWAARENSGASDYAAQVLVAPDSGRVLVIGTMTGGGEALGAYAYEA